MDEVKNDNLVQASEEQAENIVRDVLNYLQKDYQMFINHISRYPAQNQMRRESIKMFDTAFLRLQEAIINAPLSSFKVNAAPQPEAQQTPAPQAVGAKETQEAANDVVHAVSQADLPPSA